MRFGSLLLMLALTASALASSPAEAVAAAYQDVLRLPREKRPYARYLWTPPEKDADADQDIRLLIKVRANELSDQGFFGEPVPVGPACVRLDARDYGWDKRPEVWERLADLDPFFHMRVRALEDVKVRGYWPGGKGPDGKEFARGSFVMSVKAGQEFARPALWADPAVALGPGHAASMHDTLRQECLTEAPVLYGRWWLVQTARQTSIRNKDEKVGPYDWLGVRKRDDLFALAGLNAKVASERFAEWRAVVRVSGISQQNRQIAVFRASTGLFWSTLDTFAEKGRGVAAAALLPGEFDAQAEEHLFPLPNGTQYGALTKADDGSLQPSAPPQVGGDKSSLNVGNDPSVHNDLSCKRCHGVDTDGIKPIDDWARHKFRDGRPRAATLIDPSKATANTLKSLYLRDIQRLVEQSRQEYAFAYANLTRSARHPKGLTVAQLTRLYCDFGWNEYVENKKGRPPVTAAVAARELGVSVHRLKEALLKLHARRGGLDPVLSELLEDDGRLTRLEWEDRYGYCQVVVRGIEAPGLVVTFKPGGKP